MGDYMTEERRWQRLHFQSWHRGTREMDLLLGAFADAHLPQFDAAQLDAYEALLACEDDAIFGWVTGARLVPEKHKGEVLALLTKHCINANVIPAKAGIQRER
jgi:antitoxin CptB